MSSPASPSVRLAELALHLGGSASLLLLLLPISPCLVIGAPPRGLLFFAGRHMFLSAILFPQTRVPGAHTLTFGSFQQHKSQNANRKHARPGIVSAAAATVEIAYRPAEDTSDCDAVGWGGA